MRVVMEAGGSNRALARAELRTELRARPPSGLGLAVWRHSAGRPARWCANAHLFDSRVATDRVAHHECHGLAS